MTTPMELNLKLTTLEFDTTITTSTPNPPLQDSPSYQRLVGKLLQLTTTRPDISFVVQCLSQFMHSPKTSYMDVALHLARYVKSAPGLGILISSNNTFDLKVFCDVDQGSCINSRKFITGYLFQFGNSLIS